MKAYLKAKKEQAIIKEIKRGTPWVYAANVDKIEGEIVKGGIVDLYSSTNTFIARGYINLQSKILIRILTLDFNEIINEEFWFNRINEAYHLRKDLNKLSSSRIIFSEADFLPGLVVDKYGDYLVIQSTTAGIDKHMVEIEKALRKILNPKGIYLRFDVPIREKEGLEIYKGFLGEEFNTNIIIEENGIKLNVDIENGQKTGYFLDQKDNRKMVGSFSKDKTVIDLFSHTGGFALNALKGCAKHVTAVDISSLATDNIKRNANLNGYENIAVVTADIMEYLPKLVSENKKFDIVVLDPPAFTKTKDTVNSAYNGYKKINRLAMQLVSKGGYLFTFSCSRYMTRDLFLEMLNDAAETVNKRVQIIEERMQSNDHPMLLSTENSYYLKCFIIRVL